MKYLWILLASLPLVGVPYSVIASTLTLHLPSAVQQGKPDDLSPYQKKHLIFENLYGNITPAVEEAPSKLDIRRIRAQLKEKLGLKLYPHLHIGVDSVKSKASVDTKSEIIALEPHLAPRSGGQRNAKGYGIAFKLKFD